MARQAASFSPRALFAACLLVLLSWAGPSSAFAWMIRHEYSTCGACHVDPSGGGMMTAYGRAQSEVLVRMPYGKVSDDPSKVASFGFGLVRLPDELLLQGDVRVLHLRTKPPAPAPWVTRNILMQADLASAIVTDRLRASASLGYVHEGALAASVTHGENDRLVSRTHWAGVSIGEGDLGLVRAGRIPVPFGLRMLEHTSWVRSTTRTDLNTGATHGIAASFSTEKVRGELLGMVGNMQLAPPSLRERGGAGMLEWALRGNLAAGLSSLLVHTDFDPEARAAAYRHAHGAFVRYAPFHSLAVLAECDLLGKSSRASPPALGGTTFLQLDAEFVQGLHGIVSLETLSNRFAREGTSLGGWLSVHWFALPHVDLRVDLIHRDIEVGNVRAGVTSFLGQVHAFL